MVKPCTYMTLIGGTLTNTQYMDGVAHVHIHFLEIGRTEVCCHGCHSSTVYVHGRRNPVGMQEVIKKWVHQHEKCSARSADFEDWCPDVRLKVTVEDLTKPKEIPIDTQRQ